MPSKVTKIKVDGAFMFGALSFAVFRTDDCHTAVRELIIQHMKSVCEDQPRVRLLAAMRYQDKTDFCVTSTVPCVFFSEHDYHIIASPNFNEHRNYHAFKFSETRKLRA